MKKTTNSSPYQFEGRIPLSQAYSAWTAACYGYVHRKPYTSYHSYGEHVDSQRTQALQELRTALLQNAMISAGIVNLVQMFSIGPVGRKGTYRYGNLFGLSWSIK